ncbi:hypothetical protein MMC22_007132 [Lobaria immixta]|nr:hypothetical protein [Lobaria immixta]
MQTKKFFCAALFSTISLVTAEPAPQLDAETTDSQLVAQQSKVVHDLGVYLSSVTAAPDWASYSSIFAKSDDILGPNTVDFTEVTANPSFTALRNGAQSYIVSLANGAYSIVSKDLSGDTPTATSAAKSTGGTAPKPTGAMMVAGAAAAGLLGAVAML